jgi:predicted trehalose synthase
MPREGDRGELEGRLIEYISRARWWPWKTGERAPFITKLVEKNGFVHVRVSDGENLYQASFIEGDNPGLPGDRVIPFKGRFLYEAEYDSRFLENIREVSGVTLELAGDFDPAITSARPLTLDSTNVVSLLETRRGEKAVLKSYRLLPKVNMEYLCLVKLSREGFKNTPRVRGLIHEDGDPIAIILQFITGFNDAGYPFYEELSSWLRSRDIRLNLGLSAKLGVVTAGLHEALNKPGDKGFFGLEEITNNDISRWEERLSRRVNFIYEKFDEYATIKDYEWLGYWRDVFDKKGIEVVEEARSLLDKYKGGLKARIHQDLHLLQMIYNPSEGEFYIIDFEGEPGRSNDEKVEKEPPLRDVASLVRSFHYLSFSAVMNWSSLSLDHVARSLLGEDPALQWRKRHLTSMIYSYLADTLRGDIHGFGEKIIAGLDEYLKPWVVERALYEAVYELMYRPGWSPIPILGLLRIY